MGENREARCADGLRAMSRHDPLAALVRELAALAVDRLRSAWCWWRHGRPIDGPLPSGRCVRCGRRYVR